MLIYIFQINAYGQLSFYGLKLRFEVIIIIIIIILLIYFMDYRSKSKIRGSQIHGWKIYIFNLSSIHGRGILLFLSTLLSVITLKICESYLWILIVTFGTVLSTISFGTIKQNPNYICKAFSIYRDLKKSAPLSTV
jgi:hypothetical protein